MCEARTSAGLLWTRLDTTPRATRNYIEVTIRVRPVGHTLAMRARLALILAILVVVPLASLAWLGTRMAEDEARRVAERFDEVVSARLTDQAAAIGRLMVDKERALLAATSDLPTDVDALRDRLRGESQFRHLLVLDVQGRRAFPPAQGALSEAERTFVERTRGLWQGRALVHRPMSKKADLGNDGSMPDVKEAAPKTAAPTTAAPKQAVAVSRQGQGSMQQRANGPVIPLSTVAAQAPADEDAYGWHIWYWGGGLNLMFWRRRPDGRIYAVEVDRVQLLSDVVGRLPSTRESGGDERIALLDSSGRVAYVWGSWTPPAGQLPHLTQPLDAPLSAWQLAWTGAMPASAGVGGGVLTGLVAMGLSLLGLAVYFYRESTRDLRRAARRVTFVNQVSHELKTPLTNIRMYAELLEEDLFDADERTARHLGVITRESQRLSRLIGNILTFAKGQRKSLSVRRAPASLDRIVTDVVEQFRPALERCAVPLTLDLQASTPVAIDADAVGQVLYNLLSNVEKYAKGGPLRIQTRQSAQRSVLTLQDGGPGVPRGARERVFVPFERLDDSLSEGAAGTGIGLGIARDLARLHGGDLLLLPAET
ncbi:MAG: signal transduction histidine kinase, partial [Bradymonadia bacterium]